jgi:probable F420-dependent oxidoreductase
MKFWQMLTWMEPEQILDVARFAEELGFEGVMLGDHGVFPQDVKSPYPYSASGKPPMAPDSWYPDCWATIGAISAVTRRIRFAVAVYVLPLRNIFEVARATGTLALLSNNRFILGAGIGWMKDEFEIYGVDFHTRGKRFDEQIEVLRKLWGGGMVEHHGALIDFPPLQISPAPERTVPIFTGGAAPVALKRAAEKADGWIGAGNTPEEVPGILAEFRRLRQAAGRASVPSETVIRLSTPPDLATFQRLAEAGMGGGVSYPFTFTCGKISSLDQKKRVMEDFAHRFIRPLSGA